MSWRRVFGLVLATLLFPVAACGPEPTDRDQNPTPAETASATAPAPSPSGSAPSPPESPLLVPEVTPVVVGPESVAGWWNGREWVKADKGPDEVPVKGGEQYKIVQLGRPEATAAGSSPQPGCETNPGTSDIKIPGLERRGGGAPPIAVSNVGDPVPRAARALSPASKTYKDASFAVLDGLGVADSDPTVVQVVAADFDGDGKDEVVVVAEYLADQTGLFAQAGDYSVVYLRRVIDEKVRTTVIEQSIPAPAPGETPFISSHRVSAVADLNGDGRMELALSSRYYEGAGVMFYELRPDGGFALILGSGCGA